MISPIACWAGFVPLERVIVGWPVSKRLPWLRGICAAPAGQVLGLDGVQRSEILRFSRSDTDAVLLHAYLAEQRRTRSKIVMLVAVQGICGDSQTRSCRRRRPSLSHPLPQAEIDSSNAYSEAIECHDHSAHHKRIYPSTKRPDFAAATRAVESESKWETGCPTCFSDLGSAQSSSS